MAVVSVITCGGCGQKRDVWHSPGAPPPATCSICDEQVEAATKALALADLAALSVEERLSRIEEWQYDHSKRFHASRPVVF